MMYYSLDAHIRELHRHGLHVLPCWGGGKTMPGTDHAVLAENPPMLEQMLGADYRGGLAILNGTHHPLGGFIVGVDVDRGPGSWPALPRGTVYAEGGTKPTSWHLFVLTADRLDGTLFLNGRDGGIAAELKGRGTSLRSWPTVPEGKERGYAPLAFSRSLDTDNDLLTVEQLAEGLRVFIGHVLGERIVIEHYQTKERGQRVSVAAPEWLVLIFEAIVDWLSANGKRPHRLTNGGASALCPLHNDRRHPSLTLHPVRGWRCWSGCGEGKLTTLAALLNVQVGVAV